MSSTDLLEKLNFDSEKCWQTLNNGSPLTSHQLAKKLKGFGIVSKNMRINSIQVKGFDKADFVKTWAQYLPPPPAEENPFLTPIIEFPQKRVAK